MRTTVMLFFYHRFAEGELEVEVHDALIVGR
jgi:hypothetical protein